MKDNYILYYSRTKISSMKLNFDSNTLNTHIYITLWITLDT